MSENRPYSSSDFAAVPATLKVDMPERLVHRNVLGTGVATDDDFSRKRSHLVKTVDLPTRVLSMTLGGLTPGQSTRLHRHNYETVIYVVKGQGQSVLGDRTVEWQEGDAFYVPVWAWHRHANTGQSDVVYIACENAPHLQNLGLALREEHEAAG
jgi:quercetin dioxygenase-like cupin family protein